MLKYNQTTLDKLKEVFLLHEYTVRFEKGNFKSNACILENSKIIMVNKFANLDHKINALVNLLPEITIEPEKLDTNLKKFMDSLHQTELKF